MSPDCTRLSVIVVNYNTRQMTLDCISQLLADQTLLASQIIVVDNASGDGSVQALRARFPEIVIIESKQNLGFGGGNNLAMQSAEGEYLLLINTDAFVRQGAIHHLVSYLDRNPDVALVGPRLLNADGSLQRSCYRFPSPWRAWGEALWISGLFGGDHKLGDYRRWAHDKEQHVDWVIGACCLVRRAVVDEIGGFDSRFFMYAEETDWQRRMRNGGWEIGFTPSAEVVHLAGSSGKAAKSTINPEFFRSKDLYDLKYYGWIGLFISRAAAVTGCLLRLPAWAALSVLRSQDQQRMRNKFLFTFHLFVRQITDWSSLAKADRA